LLFCYMIGIDLLVFRLKLLRIVVCVRRHELCCGFIYGCSNIPATFFFVFLVLATFLAPISCGIPALNLNDLRMRAGGGLCFVLGVSVIEESERDDNDDAMEG